MHAIVSLLSSPYYEEVLRLWQELEMDCDLSGIQATPLPHFSWHIAQDYDLDGLRPMLEKLCATAKPFTVRTTGLGLFTGENPVIYLPLVREQKLSRFHRTLWQEVWSLSVQPSPYYDPQAWMPHITIAYGDVNQNTLGCAMEKLAFRRMNWEIEVDHLALVYQLDSEVGELGYKLDFAGGNG